MDSLSCGAAGFGLRCHCNFSVIEIYVVKFADTFEHSSISNDHCSWSRSAVLSVALFWQVQCCCGPRIIPNALERKCAMSAARAFDDNLCFTILSALFFFSSRRAHQECPAQAAQGDYFDYFRTAPLLQVGSFRAYLLQHRPCTTSCLMDGP